LWAQFLDINNVTDSLKNEISLPVGRIEDLEDKLVASKYNITNSSSAKLDHILSSQKPYGYKYGLGFDQNTSTSKTTPVNNRK
jgi:hypothetical protein